VNWLVSFPCFIIVSVWYQIKLYFSSHHNTDFYWTLILRLRNDLYCVVGWGVKLYSLTHSLDTDKSLTVLIFSLFTSAFVDIIQTYKHKQVSTWKQTEILWS